MLTKVKVDDNRFEKHMFKVNDIIVFRYKNKLEDIGNIYHINHTSYFIYSYVTKRRRSLTVRYIEHNCTLASDLEILIYG